MKTINIADILLSPDLGSRVQARGFRRFVGENYSGESVTIDFSGVQFSSRAFMDEFYNLFLSPAVSSESKVEVEVANMPDDIAAPGEVFFHYQQPKWEVQSEDSAWWGSDDREFEIFDCPIDIEVEKPIEVELLFKTV